MRVYKELNNDKKKFYSSAFDVITVASILVLIVAIFCITEFTGEKYPAYGSNRNTDDLASTMNNPTSLSAVSDFRFAAAGDWGCTAATSTTVKDIQNKDPELVLALGDLSYQTLEIAGFIRQYYK